MAEANENDPAVDHFDPNSAFGPLSSLDTALEEIY
jgi:hypothetical protein